MRSYYFNIGMVLILLIGGILFSCMRENKISVKISQSERSEKLLIELFNSTDSTIYYHTEKGMLFYSQFKVFIKGDRGYFPILPKKRFFYCTTWITDSLLPSEKRNFFIDLNDHYDVSKKELNQTKFIKVNFMIDRGIFVKSNTIKYKFGKVISGDTD